MPQKNFEVANCFSSDQNNCATPGGVAIESAPVLRPGIPRDYSCPWLNTKAVSKLDLKSQVQ
ncbi:MAG: hypothetical protein QOJ64_2078 [Acidobacteriota bacterium]|jgi:hypothetical protein|nr:hypothetical protein [Acidobacteriota bacterium]